MARHLESAIATDEEAADSSTAEVVQLHRRYRATRDRDVAGELIARYEPLAHSLTNRFSYRSDIDDLRQVALTALVSALNHFDPDRGVPFSTYAVPTIAGAIKRYFRDQGWQVKPPRRLQETFLEARRARDELELELGRSPTVHDVAGHLRMPVTEVRASLDAAGAMERLSLDAKVRDTANSFADTFCAGEDKDIETSDKRLLVRELLQRLSEQERAVVVLSYFADIPQREIAARLGTNQVGVSRTKRRALKRLRTIHDEALAKSA
jgi:RNA polymerase sigma-B factor